ncbi:hypothetical protein ACI1MP_30235 [Kitasatospora griseola]|uniref:hypothetical protein n=1 Tax=Kitasatospora griseola TaxID=2064 RepID=UPI003855F30D
MRRATFAWVAAAAAVVVAAGPAVVVAAGSAMAGQSGEPEHGTPGTGEILPHPGPDGFIWIPDWIGNGGAVGAGLNMSGPPVTVTVGCQGGSSGPGEVHVSFGGGTTPVEFTVACPADTIGRGSAVVPVDRISSLSVGVETSAPDVHWGLTITQPDA